jgi:hypothetical protein
VPTEQIELRTFDQDAGQLPAIYLAAEKGFASLLKKDGVELLPGTYPIDATFTARLRGAVERQPDGEMKDAPTIPLPVLLAKLLKAAGLGRDEAKKLIAKHVLDAIDAGEDIPDAIRDRVLDADTAVAEAKGKRTGVKPKKGSTFWRGTISVVPALHE